MKKLDLSPRYPEMRVTVLSLPERGDEQRKDIFSQACDAIMADFRVQQSRIARLMHDGVSSTVIATAKAQHRQWLAETAYATIAALIEGELTGLMKSRIKKSPRGKRGVEVQLANPFQGGLLALFLDWPSGQTPQERERLGKQLWHAYRHFVPLEFVAGYIAVLDETQMRDDIRNDRINPAMYQSMAKARLFGESFRGRGKIDGKVKAKISKATRKYRDSLQLGQISGARSWDN